MGSATLDRVVWRVRRRLCFAAWIGEWARMAGVALVIAGGAALLWRRFGAAGRGEAAWLALLVVPAALLAWARARRRFVSASTVAAWLDVRHGGDGRIVTAFERADSREEGRGSVAPPELRLRHLLLARPLLPALLFLALALGLPLPASAVALDLPRLHADQLDQLAEKLATLEETVELDAGLRAELEERLERAKEALEEGLAEEGLLASAFEARDTLEARLEQEAAVARDGVELAQAELGSDALTRALDADASRAEELLGQTLDALVDAGLAQKLPAELQRGLADLGLLDLPGLDGAELPPGTKLDPAQVAAMKELAAQLERALGAQLKKLVESGLINLAEQKPFDGKLVFHECTEACRQQGGG